MTVASSSSKKKQSKKKQSSQQQPQQQQQPEQLELKRLKVASIVPNPDQPRREFNKEELEALADTIKSSGRKQVFQPIMVQPLENGKYRITDGERRWRACKKLGIKEILAFIDNKTTSSKEAAVQSLIMNLQRQDLSPVEIEDAVYSLYKEHNMTLRTIAKMIGKSHVMISDYIKAKEARDMLINEHGLLSMLNKIEPPLSLTDVKTTWIKESESIKDGNLRALFIVRLMEERHQQHTTYGVPAIRAAAKVLQKASPDFQELFRQGQRGIRDIVHATILQDHEQERQQQQVETTEDNIATRSISDNAAEIVEEADQQPYEPPEQEEDQDPEQEITVVEEANTKALNEQLVRREDAQQKIRIIQQLGKQLARELEIDDFSLKSAGVTSDSEKAMQLRKRKWTEIVEHDRNTKELEVINTLTDSLSEELAMVSEVAEEELKVRSLR